MVLWQVAHKDGHIFTSSSSYKKKPKNHCSMWSLLQTYTHVKLSDTSPLVLQQEESSEWAGSEEFKCGKTAVHSAVVKLASSGTYPDRK